MRGEKPAQTGSEAAKKEQSQSEGLPSEENNSENNTDTPPEEKILDVECGPNKAGLYLSKLCQGSKGPCVLFNGSWLTPNEFQYVSGRETAKDWKRSIRHFGKSMKLLLTKGILSLNPPLCNCENCTGEPVTDTEKQNSTPEEATKPAPTVLAKKVPKSTGEVRRKNGQITHVPSNKSATGDGRHLANSKKVKKAINEKCDKIKKDGATSEKEGTKSRSPKAQTPTDDEIAEKENINVEEIDVVDNGPEETAETDQVSDDIVCASDEDKTSQSHEDEDSDATLDPEPEIDDEPRAPPASSAVSEAESKACGDEGELESAPESHDSTTMLPAEPKATASRQSTASAQPSPLPDQRAQPLDTKEDGAEQGIDMMDGQDETEYSHIEKEMIEKEIKDEQSTAPNKSGIISDDISTAEPRSPARVTTDDGGDKSSSPCTKDNASDGKDSIEIQSNCSSQLQAMADVIELKPTSDVARTEDANLKEPKAIESQEKREERGIEVVKMDTTSQEFPRDPISSNQRYSSPPPLLISAPSCPRPLPGEIDKSMQSTSSKHSTPVKQPSERGSPVHETERSPINSHHLIANKDGGQNDKDAASRIFAPVTWPPIGPEGRGKEGKLPSIMKSDKDSIHVQKPTATVSSADSHHEEKNRFGHSASPKHKSKVTTVTSSPPSRPEVKKSSATVTHAHSAPQVAHSAPQMASLPSSHEEYLRHLARYQQQPVATSSIDESYLALLRRYYEWSELSKNYPYGVTPSYNRWLPMFDPRATEVAKSPYCLMDYPQYYYGMDPRLMPGVLPTDMHACASERDLEAAARLYAGLDSRDQSKSSVPTTSSSSSINTSGSKRAFSEETGGEVLDLSVKKRKLTEGCRTVDQDLGGHRDVSAHLLSAGPIPPHPLAASPLNCARYPGMYWDLSMFQPSSIPGMHVPPIPTSPYLALPKEQLELAMNGTRNAQIHACASSASRDRLLSQMRHWSMEDMVRFSETRT